MTHRTSTLTTDADRQALYAFRYAIVVDEMQIDTDEADHDRRTLSDPLDAHSTHHVLYDGDTIVGELRTTPLADVPDPTSLVLKYSMKPALVELGGAALVVHSRLLLHPDLRGGGAIGALVRRVFEDGLAAGHRVSYTDCSPHLVGLYEQLGYRRFTDAFRDTAYGFKLPMLMIADHAHFERVRSPLADILADRPRDEAVCAWFGRAYPEWGDVTSAAFLSAEDFLSHLEARVAGDPLHAIGLLRGLDAEEAALFLESAAIVRVQPGNALIRKDEHGDALFVQLSGVSEVKGEDRDAPAVRVLGAGDLFGEIGFVGGGVRTASVVAKTYSEVLVLSSEFLHRFLEEQPRIGGKILLNMSRVLAERLVDCSARLDGSRPPGA